MYKAVLSSNHCIVAYIDMGIYSENVISKSLYWLSSNYTICRENLPENKQKITFEKNGSPITDSDFNAFKADFCQKLIDYKNREIINEETKDIRNILYVKAFANNDGFIEFDFSE